MINTRLLSAQIISRVFDTNSFADVLLDISFEKYKMKPKDRAFTTELVFGTLRWLGLLDWIIQKAYTSDWIKVPSIVKRILEVGLYQIMFMDKVPDYASVNESVKIAVEKKGMVWGRVVNGVLREIIRDPRYLEKPSIDKDPAHAISIAWSHPKWIVERWLEAFGLERTEAICSANNKRPEIGIRINPLKTDKERIVDVLEKKGIEVGDSRYVENFVSVAKGSAVLNSEDFSKGYYSIQDESAGLIGCLMDPKPGERILDMAAAPGGKTTHLAELSHDQAIVVAADRHPMRMVKVQENIRRLGLEKVFPVLADGTKPAVQNADKVLIDAPCSGMGVIRRRGEIRWRMTPDLLPGRIHLQKALIESAAGLLKPGGVLVYSTCSILPEENDSIVEDFLQEHTDFEIEDAKQFVNPSVVNEKGYIETWPDRHGIDGSFGARLRRKR